MSDQNEESSEGDPGWQVDSYGRYYVSKGDWWAIVDQSTGRVYYQNQLTQQTQWDLPDDWKHDREDETEKMMKRPARRQMKPQDKSRVHWRPEGGHEYNIWYHKWVGEHWKGEKDQGPSDTRCNIKRDTGYTKGSVQDPKSEKVFFCLYFARGCCENGAECNYLHRLPLPNDTDRIDLGHDCFGRDRHQSHRDDMGGVGSFEKECRTLYVGGLSIRSGLEKVLSTEFGEWGELEEVKIIPRLHIAFLTYKNRMNAEFAKIAMGDQQLDGGEMVNVRWAYDDPNPKAKVKVVERTKQQFADALQTYYSEGKGGLPAEQLQPYAEGCVIGPYPDTAEQFAAVEAINKEEEEKVELLRRVEQDCDRLDQAFKLAEYGGNQLTAVSSTVSAPPAPPSLQPTAPVLSQSSTTSPGPASAAPGPILPSHGMVKQSVARCVDPYRAAMRAKSKAN